MECNEMASSSNLQERSSFCLYERLKKFLLERCDCKNTAQNNLDLLDLCKYEEMIEFLTDNPEADDDDINIKVGELMRYKWDHNLDYLRSELEKWKML